MRRDVCSRAREGFKERFVIDLLRSDKAGGRHGRRSEVRNKGKTGTCVG